jgi:hypothetical protein
MWTDGGHGNSSVQTETWSKVVEVHPYSFKVMTDPLEELRHRWTVCEGSQIHVRSPCSYATRGEAEKEAAKAVARRVEHWRNGE